LTLHPESCLICSKHAQGDAAEGGVLYEDELVYAGHIHTLRGPTAYRGWCTVEAKRHVAELGDLDVDEAEAIGRLMRVVAGAQQRALGAEHVYAFVFGDGVPHLHVHLAPRFPGTPIEYWGARLGEWPDSPRVDSESMAEVVTLLRASITDPARRAP
jgi:diadenosine tetraphosphate (Ap4A) HIT family hydrolase